MERLLPLDIIMDIFSRLPIKTILQCKCVCKNWFNIISNPTFSIVQFSQATNVSNPDIILNYKYNLYFAENNDDEYNKNHPILSCKKIDNSPVKNTSSMANLSVLGSYNGLLCLTVLHKIRFLGSNPIYIFNPITGDRLRLPDPQSYEDEDKPRIFLSGLGFDVSIGKFKIVLAFCYSDDSKSELQVHTLGSNIWRRKVGIVPIEPFDSLQDFSFVFVNGSLHWITIADNFPNSRKLVITSFHFGVEEFGIVPKPKSVVVDPQLIYPRIYFVLGVLDEHLSLVDSSSRNFIRIWFKKNDNGKKSWIKKFVIQKNLVCRQLNEAIVPIKLREKGEILFLLLGSEYMVSYNIESRKCRSLKVGSQESDCTYFDAIPVTSSLISVRSLQNGY
ncbi:F-box protein [Thalictrum thalictroides]|uniref:F-box protein n=1 Tax=Thalictrum thalictroides TaxID=46969 RepID=A0A7J6WDF1_THATH|nr:F-box protein [Thalictrum thalictroides]